MAARYPFVWYLSQVAGPGPDCKLVGAAKWSADTTWRTPGPATPVPVPAGYRRRTGRGPVAGRFGTAVAAGWARQTASRGRS
jgi:hypothetical protein